jgi:glycosyltransferase involved in cell wall biosynthesis
MRLIGGINLKNDIPEIITEKERQDNVLSPGLNIMVNRRKKLPKVSIVLPTYNGAKYLRTSIDSCLAQTCKDFELIIVDDASSDETASIIKSYTDPRIRYVRNSKNQRLPNSLNIGFKEAKGQYLTWTSDDNVYAPHAIGTMLKSLEMYRYDFVYADNFIFDNDDLSNAQHLMLTDYGEISKSNCIRACFLYSRRVMEKVGLYDPDMELIEDYDYWVRISKHFYMHHLKEPLYYYRYHQQQLYTARNREIKVIELLFKFKYGFMPLSLVSWNLRNLPSKSSSSSMARLWESFLKRAKVNGLLGKYQKGFLSFTSARKLLNQVIYYLPVISKKTFVFLRRIPVPPEGEWGGLEKLMFDWFQRIDYYTSDVYLAVSRGWKRRFLEEAQKYNLPLNVVEIPFDFNDKMFRRFFNMLSFLKNFKPNVVVYFQGHFMEFSAAEVLAGSLTSKGNVYMHENLGSMMPPEKSSKRHFGFLPGLGLWWQLNRGLVNIRAYMAKKVLVVSQEIKSRYVSWWKYPQEQIVVMHHGTDIDKYLCSPQERQELRFKLNIDLGETVIITTARFTKQKRLERIIQAFNILSKEFKNLRLLMAGEGPLENELKDLAQSLPCRNRITFLGQLNDTSPYLKASDIFVLSSDNEGLSLALLEAMASGLICISTDCTGSNEAISNENLGLIVEKSTEGVAQGLRKVLLLPKEKQEEIAGTAQVYARSNFDLNTNIQKAFKTIGLVN